MIYTTLHELIEQEITPAIKGSGPGFDIDGFVRGLCARNLIVYRTFDGAAQSNGFELVTDEDGLTPGFWELVEEYDSDTISELRISDIVAAVNTYETASRPETHNIWMDLITSLPEYDDEATAVADPNFRNDVIVLTDGTHIIWDYDRQEWSRKSVHM